MAKKVTESEEDDFILTMPRPRLVKLIIKNFRSIGSNPVEIDLNNIVVLVGPNNVGKSSILKAYEVVMSDGSKASELKLSDFHNRNPENYPEIELHTIVFDERVGKHWLTQTADGEWMVKEKWTWFTEGKPKRQGWDVTTNDWHVSSYPFGPAAKANKRRPEPHIIDAFDKPDDQAQAIKDLLMAGIQQRVQALQNSDEANDYQTLLDNIKAFQRKIVDESKEQIDAANIELSKMISQVFPGYVIDFDAKPEDGIEKTINLFKASSELLMGPSGGYLSTIDKQGSGARRTLLWTALKFISESKGGAERDKSHLLLIDEPEICLHPNAIREACKVLYDLPSTGNWQVMVTTHSPIFIDFSQDNTTIIRVEKDKNGEVKGTTVFKPDTVKLGKDDKENLKLLNLCDPYVGEFFFGGKVIIVEGDTEYTAFNYIKNLKPDEYRDVHIIRARGKATIVSLCKILNQFGTDFSVLHDSDRPLTNQGKGNPAWGNNPSILNTIMSRPEGTKVRLLASVPNFEEAYFSEEIKTDKPYNALATINSNPDKLNVVEHLFKSLIDHAHSTPANCYEWSNIDDLERAVNNLQN